MASLIGQTLGQYKIISLLGAGGMATVYRAHQESIERDVALKVIRPNLTELDEFIQRFRREAKTVASLSHPHILKVFDYGQFGEMAYLVMELLTGGSLADLIRKGPLSLETTGRMLDQIASALDFAHQNGIIHRDLKPQNVLLDTNGNAFLSDFGIAKLVEGGQQLTQSGAVMGTPAYMSPELWSNQSVDSRADVYALGVMLFEMLTGQLPFNGNTPFALMHQHIYETARSVNEVNEKVPPAIADVVNRAMAKDREQRYSTAGELAAAFRAVISGTTPQLDVKYKPLPPPTVRLDDQTIVAPPPPIVPSQPVAASSGGSRLIVPALIGIVVIGALLVLFMSRNQPVVPTATPEPPTAVAAAASATTVATATLANTATPRPTETVTLTPSLVPTIDEEGTLNAVVQLTGTGILRSTQLASTISARLTQTEQAKPTNTFTPSNTPTATRTPTETYTPSETPTITLTPTETAIPTETYTPAPSNTPKPTATPLPPPTSAPTATVSLGLGSVAFEFGSEGTGSGKFNDLRYVAVDTSGNIYTGEYSTARIQKFDATGKFITSWIPDGKSPLTGLAADRVGNVYAVRQGKVYKYDDTGKLLKTFGNTSTFYDGIAILPDGNLLVAATGISDDIIKMNAANGNETQRFKEAISSQSEKSELDMHVTADGLGTIYALGSFNRAVFVFNASGKFQTRFGELQAPDSVAVDGQSRVYVSDFGEIKVFDKSGKPLGSIKIPNHQCFQLAITDNGDLYVASRDRVYRITVNIPGSK